MSMSVRDHVRFLGFTVLWFVVFSVPSLVLRWWHPDPLGSFSEPKYRWMHELLSSPPRARVGLVGSSQMKAAADAVKISEHLYGRSDAVLNLGTSWAGRGRDYFLARELVKGVPTLELLVVEVGRTESDELHPHFHRLGSLGDTFNDPLNDLATWRGFEKERKRIEFWVVGTVGNTVAGYAQVLYRSALRLHFSFEGPTYFAATGGWKPAPWHSDGALRPLTARDYVPDRRRRSVHYLDRIAELCRTHGIELIFVEVPRYRDRPLGGAYSAYLEELGSAVLAYPARQKLYGESHWSDRGHMNTLGATLFSDWLTEELHRRASTGAAHDPPTY